MIRQDGQRVDRESVRLGQRAEATDEVVPVVVIVEKELAVEPPAHYMIEDICASRRAVRGMTTKRIP